MIKKWCLEHGEQSPKHKSAAVRYIDDSATGLTITFAEHGGKPVVRIQNERSEHVGRYVLETDQVFFVTLRERKSLETDYPTQPPGALPDGSTVEWRGHEGTIRGGLFYRVLLKKPLPDGGYAHYFSVDEVTALTKRGE